ncbi:MAG: hypothetical protein ABIN80_28580 [Dyadobacter sp.]
MAKVENSDWPNFPFPDSKTKESVEKYYRVRLHNYNLVSISIAIN